MRQAWLLLLLPCFTGCATATLATLGTVAGLGATAVGTGANVYSLGKLDSAEAHGVEATYRALQRATQDLSLQPTLSLVEGRKWFVRYEDAQQAQINVTLDERTRTLTRMRIDVGLFGSEPTARLILMRVRDRLGEPTTRAAGAE